MDWCAGSTGSPELGHSYVVNLLVRVDLVGRFKRDSGAEVTRIRDIL